MKTKPKVKGNYIMKKIIALALAAVFVLSFAACAKQNGESGTTTPSDVPKGQVKSALEILEKVWSKYSTDEKFPATGGSEKHMKEDMSTGRSAVRTAARSGSFWINGEREKARRSRDTWIMKWKESTRS